MSDINLAARTTGRSTRGRTPVWRVMIDGVEQDVTAQSCRIEMGKGHHDLATLDLTSTDRTDVEGLINKPLSFVFGSSPRLETFYGYVLGAEEVTSSDNVLNFVLVLGGSSIPLQDGEPRFFRNRTIPQVVRQVVLGAGLGSYGQDDADDFAWPTIAQTSESDWQLCTKLADRIGWWLIVRHGAVGVFNPVSLLTDEGAYAVLESSTDELADNTSVRRLVSFDPQEVGDETPDTLRSRFAFLEDGSNRLVKVEQQDDPTRLLRKRQLTRLVVHSRGEADAHLAAENLKDRMMEQKAEARLWGEADLHPGMSVDVRTSNTRYYNRMFNGRWLIAAVTHILDRSQFQTQLKLERPDSFFVQDTPYRSLWERDGRPKPSMYADADGHWVSSWSNARVGSVS